MTTIVVLEQARASFAQCSWCDAFERFATADAAAPLDPDDLEKLALAAYLAGLDAESTRAWTRAHHEAVRRNDPLRAVRNAVLIGAGLLFRGESAPAMGWFARGERVLEGCGDCAERGWLLTWNAFVQMWGGDLENAQAAFAESVTVGRSFDDADLLAMSRLGQGMCLVMQGQGRDGMALLDEVMVGVTSGEVSPMYAGDVIVDTSNQERITVRTGQQLWDWTIGSNPIPGQLVADLTDRQCEDIIGVLDGMIRERSGGKDPLVLTAPLNIGVGTK